MATPSVYQRVGNAAVTPSDYDSSVGKVYLRFDGVDDWLVTPSIDFTGTDKVSVFVGVRKLSDGMGSCLLEFSPSIDENNGAFDFRVPAAAGGSNYLFRSKGTAPSLAITPSNYPVPHTGVLAQSAQISTKTNIMRVNGVQAAQSITDQGTGSYGNYPLYIGRRGGTVLPFNGHIYGLLIRGALSSYSQISAVEKFMNSKTGAY